MERLSTYGCTSCYSPFSSAPSEQGKLNEHVVQNLVGIYYLIYLCADCQAQLRELEFSSDLNAGLKFLQKSINRSILFADLKLRVN